jgi:8-oxo-dGTP pyrophosphatase MutT (NUDIX family)
VIKMTGQILPPEQWYASLPTFLASAGGVITDPDGAVLLVKPNYRPWWNLPGGVVEGDEPPHLACARELAEELGLDRPVGRLLVIDWIPPTDLHRAWFGFVFDAGTLTDTRRIRLQAEELDAVEFVRPDEALDRLNPIVAARLAAALRVREGQSVAYLHEGVPAPT